MPQDVLDEVEHAGLGVLELLEHGTTAGSWPCRPTNEVNPARISAAR